MDGSEYNNLLRYLTKKEYNGKLTANEERVLRKRAESFILKEHNEKFTANEKRALKYIRIFQLN